MQGLRCDLLPSQQTVDRINQSESAIRKPIPPGEGVPPRSLESRVSGPRQAADPPCP
jgi:hypothetical protein